MSFTQTFLVQCLLFIPLPYILFAAPKSRRVMPLAVLQVLVGVVMGPSLFGRCTRSCLGRSFDLIW
jgi:hypothetical protein